ncbi:SOSS complex subunit C [Blattella germanica]|nr:SOSS complex subunit C [Blattella germanica]
MAFQPPSARQELASRKILEEIQLKKQQILKQGVAPTLNSPTLTPSLSAVGPGVNLSSSMSPEAHMMSSTQRAALQHAHSQSFGYFVTQDSSFGNLILPVLPRFDK